MNKPQRFKKRLLNLRNDINNFQTNVVSVEIVETLELVNDYINKAIFQINKLL